MSFLKSKNRIVLVVLVVLGLVLLAVGSWYYFSVIKSRVTREDVDGLRVEVQQLMNQQKYAETESTLQTYLDEHPNMPPEFKYEVYTFLAGNYINLKNFQAALEWYQKAAEVDPEGLRYGNALGIAQMAQAVGNNQLAIEYYKKTIEIAKLDPNPVNDTFVQSYERVIMILEDPKLSAEFSANPTQGIIDPNIPPELKQSLPQ